jgi:hypothetical protein
MARLMIRCGDLLSQSLTSRSENPTKVGQPRSAPKCASSIRKARSISCLDSEPGKVVATQLRRDVSQELDDYFEIVIDSSHNRRNAYVFQFNPLGTQRDALITDEQPPNDDGSDGDSGWDGVWISEARINSRGWTATVAISFSTLNFMQTKEVVWGINFKRFIRRKNEQDLWSAWRRTFGKAVGLWPVVMACSYGLTCRKTSEESLKRELNLRTWSRVSLR